MRFSKKCGKPQIFGIFDHFGSNFGQTRPKMTNFRVFLKKQKRHFSHSLRLAFMQKIRKIQYAVFEKIWITFDFGHFLPFWIKFWKDAAQNVKFLSFPEKTKNVTFLHSLRLAFMQNIRKFQCAVSEKIWRTETTERHRDRDEGEFIGPNPPGGRQTKN